MLAPTNGRARAAARGTVVVPLEHLRVIRATGEDASGFLHNLFSNDVKKLGANEAQLNSFNSPKGRMLASMLWRRGSDYLLALSADIHAAMLKKLSMYVLRSKVRLLDDGSDSVLIGLAGPRPAPPSKPPAASRVRTIASGIASVVRLDGARFAVGPSRRPPCGASSSPPAPRPPAPRPGSGWTSARPAHRHPPAGSSSPRCSTST
jgi:folate-binding Fe-S cluster repair protein YgfZ